MLKRLLSLVLSTIIILSAFTAFPVSVNAEEVTENKENSYGIVEIQAKPELASTGASGETYEQAARYVPNYVITGTDTIQPMYNPYTAQMLLDLSDDAYKIGNEGWQRTLNKLGYTTRIQTDGMLSYAVAEISSGDGVPVIPINTGSFYAIIGAKRVIYNGKEKTAFVIAFRGTKSLQDLIGVDFSVLPNLEGFHSGFKTSSSEFLSYFKDIQFSFNGEIILGNDILNEMKTENSKYSMLVTGHSLGGALADIFVGYDLYELGIHPSNLMAYTFAAPNSAPSYYSYPYKNIINIYNTDDYVPTIPSAYKRIGTDFAVDFNDDERRDIVYKNHHNNINYALGQPASYWSMFGVQTTMGFAAHTPIGGETGAYQLTINKINNSVESYTKYNTNGDNTWDKVIIIPECYNRIKGNLTVKGRYDSEQALVLKNSSLLISGNADIHGIDMQHDDDYLLVTGNCDFRGYSAYILTAGTVEVKGNFTKHDNNVNSTGYYEEGTHKTVFSGNDIQIIDCNGWLSDSTWGRSSYRNVFENLVIRNPKVKFSTPLYKMKLLEDATLLDTTGLTITKTLDLNGHTLTVGNGITLKGEMCVQGERNIINGNLVITGNFSRPIEFINGSLTVDGDIDIVGLTMQHDDDYLLVTGNCDFRGYSAYILTAGTVEVKGNFTKHDNNVNNTGYKEEGTHKTILSGDSLQIVNCDGWVNKSSWSYSSYNNCFSTLILENSSEEGILFEKDIIVTKLFNHKRNTFILYNNGSGSTFVDYDGDGMLDNVDPHPTDPNNTPPTQEPTQLPTQDPTQPPTQEPTQPPTQESTQSPTQEPTQAPTQDPSNSSMILGDVDGDGTVTIIDATCIQRHLASIPTFAFIEALADTDGDGVTTILDATYIQRWLASLPSNDNIGKTIK